MSEQLQTLINSLSISNFRKLIQEYSKEKYKTPHVRIIDGPYDGGNDLEILIKDKEIRKNIQVTVHKQGFESKLEEDIIKAKENAKKFGYLKKLDFYISQNVSKEKRNQLILDAEVNHGIILEIIDGKILASEAVSFPSITKVTYEAHGINLETQAFKSISKESKILFDVLTLSKNTVEARKNILYSLIYSYLFSEGESTLDELTAGLKEKFETEIEKDDLFRELNLLKSRNEIITPHDKTLYDIPEAKRLQIEEINGEVVVQENRLNEDIQTFISEEDLQCTAIELVQYLKDIHIENYHIDIEEVNQTANSFSASLKRAFNDLERYIQAKGKNQADSKKLTRKLLEKCAEYDYFNKLATASLFSNLYGSDKLESYFHSKSRQVLIDTQILLRILCVLYSSTHEFKDSAFKAVRHLLKALQRDKEKIEVLTTYDYVSEVAGHLEEAIKLQRFLKLPYIEDLGLSKNVFFNAYIRFKDSGVLEDDFEFDEFIDELTGEPISQFVSSNFINEVSETLANLYEAAGIQIIYHPMYENFQDLRKEYEVSLSYSGKERSFFARENDLRTILYLSEPENHTNKENGQLNEPFLITWDSTFYDFRGALLRKHKNRSYFYIYSPLKFIDRMSLLNYRVSPSSVTSNVIALAETNFNYSNKTNSFFDVISTFFNKDDVSELSIIKRMASWRKELLGTTEEDTLSEDIFDSRETPVTNLLLELRNHYASGSTKFSIKNLVQSFETEENSDKIMSILHKSLPKYLKTSKLDSLFNEFDDLIENTLKTSDQA